MLPINFSVFKTTVEIPNHILTYPQRLLIYRDKISLTRAIKDRHELRQKHRVA